MKYRLPVDFILQFCGEAKPGFGEDNWCHVFREDAGMLGVFDGCGGAGAKKHEEFAEHSEAYMASRFCAGVFYESFLQGGFERGIGQLTEQITARFADNTPPRKSSDVVIKGTMVRTLPTTAAAAAVQCDDGRSLVVTAIWAGDSRVYAMDKNGISQLTADDTSQPDPMEGQYDDGVLNNVICSSKTVRLNATSYRISLPCVVFAATDGCFGYVSTPMEFEGMLLHSLMESKTPVQWEEKLREEIAEVAGDDHTMCMGVFGFKSFDALKKYFAPRYEALEAQYLEQLRDMPREDRDSRRALWAGYKKNYMKYLEGEAT